MALRVFALLGAGALAVHELRFLAGWGSDAGSHLTSHGHSYLSFATALSALLLIVAFGVFLTGLARGGEPARDRRVGLWSLWLLASVALLAIYTSQELIEGAVAPGHPDGLAGAFGAGGWTALPLAGFFGVLVALLLRCAEEVLVHAAARRRFRWGAAPAVLPTRPAGEVVVRVRTGLATHLAGRAPPALGS